MRTNRLWHGVRLRRFAAGLDADARPRRVTIPASWGEDAACAFSALAPGSSDASLPETAEVWIAGVVGRAAANLPESWAVDSLADKLHTLLIARRAAPDAPIWHGEADPAPIFVLNLTSFLDGSGFDVGGFADAVETVTLAAALACPAAHRLRIGFCDLAGLLPGLGVSYESEPGREVARCLAAVLRAKAESVSAALGATLGSLGTVADWPLPASSVIPGLADAAARRPAPGTPLRHLALVALTRPGPAEALLGAETGGYAPPFSPLAADGRLTRTAERALAAGGLSPQAALAAVYAGHDPLPIPGVEAQAAMHAALAPIFDALPAPAGRPGSIAARCDLPARHTGYTQRAVVGGHRLFLRTGEYDDGRLGEMSIALPREGAAFRGLMEAFCNAVTIGLQHGVALEAFIDAFTLTRFGPGGAVEGDPAVPYATSILDYAFRHLAAHYLRKELPPAGSVEPEREPAELPLLAPFERNGLRLVSDNGRR